MNGMFYSFLQIDPPYFSTIPILSDKFDIIITKNYFLLLIIIYSNPPQKK